MKHKLMANMMILLMLLAVCAGSSFAIDQPVINADDLQQVLIDNRIKDIQIVTANIHQTSTETWVQTLTLDKGESDGICLGMIAISKSGLVGYVSSVDRTSAEVHTILHQSSSVTCEVRRTYDQGILMTEESGDHVDTTILYLPTNSNSEPGDMVVTSGNDKTYPRGIKIGYVINNPHEDAEMPEGSMAVLLSESLMQIEEVYLFQGCDH